MKRAISAIFCIVFSLAVVSARAQVVPAATSHTFSLSAGALGSGFQPDYAGDRIAQTSPNRLYGVGTYVDARFSRWVQVEAEGRWSRFNKYPCPECQPNDESTYLIGPRIPIVNFHGLSPYGKVLVGLGNGGFLDGNTFVLSYGGGVDYHLGRSRFTIRAFDFEWQQWRVNPTLYPYGYSVGISYKIF